VSRRKHPIFFAFFLAVLISSFFLFAGWVAMHLMGDRSLLTATPKVGVVLVKGVIFDSRPTLEQMKKYLEDDQVKAIILRLDSAGSAVAPAQEIYREIGKVKTKKKVVAPFGSVAASGAYYMASACDHIVANPGTLTGSIGVVMELPNFRELLKKIGVSLEVVKSGEFKDTGSPVRRMTSQEKELLETLIRDIHRQFVGDVARARKLSREQIESVANARVISGEEAKRLGLVDTLGNFNDAVDQAKKLAKIEGEVKILYPEKKKISLLDLVWGRVEEGIQETMTRTLFTPVLLISTAVLP
jgi:protease-4